MVTAKEAKKILLEQRKRNRERQKEHMEKMRAQGYRRIAVLISGEAHKALERAVKNQEKTKSELVTEAIISTFDESNSTISVPRGINVSANESSSHVTNISKKKPTSNADEIIMKLKANGMSCQAIVDKLNADGVPTATGKGQWHKGTVSNMVKRLKKDGQLTAS